MAWIYRHEHMVARLYPGHGPRDDDALGHRAAQLDALAAEGWALICVSDGLAYLRRGVRLNDDDRAAARGGER